MFRLSKLFVTLLLLIVCACSVDDKKYDEELFLGSGDGSSPTAEFLSVTPLKGGDIEFDIFEHVYTIDDLGTVEDETKDTKSQGCEISASSVSHGIQTCLVEVNELDIHIHGLELEINTPPQMCKYLELKNYWYYNYEVGKGAGSVSITNTIATDGSSTYTCKSGTQDCISHPELIFDDTTGVVSCIYDYSVDDGPNCCIGRYNLSTTVITHSVGDPDASPPVLPPPPTVDSSSEAVEWGGDWAACISGPGTTDNWPQKKINGATLPANKIYDTRTGGIKTKIKILSPVEQNSRGNVFAANFYKGALIPGPPDPTNHPHFHGPANNPSKLPVGIDPIADRSGDYITKANDAYSILCLDEAHEVLQQINVYIREWNTADKYAEYVSDVTGTTSPNPDIGDNLTTTEDNIICGKFPNESLCNDYFDWDNLILSYPHL